MKTLEFGNNRNMHALGLGTWKAKGNEVKKAVKDALHAGYRHIDTAAIYDNEKEIGEALQEVFSEGRIMREDVWITSKLWNDAHKKGYVIPALQDSLEKLQLHYLDLYLMHWPVAFKPNTHFPQNASDYYSLEEVPLSETWEQMEFAKKKGFTKYIGVSNFNTENLKTLMEKGEIKPEMNQVEMHPLLPQNDLYDFCKSEDIHMTAYSPLGSIDRSSSMKSEDEPSLLDLSEIKELAKKHQVGAAQILIAWHLQRGTAVIPKSTTKEHIVDNFKAASVKLEKEDMEKINSIDKSYRFLEGDIFKMPEKGYHSIF